MLKTRPLLSEEQLSRRILELSVRLNHDYQGLTIDVVCLLKGSLFFAADLIRRLTFPLRIHFIQVSSYASGTESSGTVHLHFSSDFELEGRDVLLIEDILDTGITLQYVQNHLRQKKPNELRTCVLLDKPSRRKVDLRADYTGFEIEDVFVVGYGLDFKEIGRNLPYVAVLLEE